MAIPHSSNSVAPKPAMETPEGDPELRTLRLIRPYTGNMASEVNARKGSVVVAVTCLGSGTLRIDVSPIGSFDLPCGSYKVNRTLNQMDLEKAERLTLSVSSTPSVTWSMRVQQ
jgi:hypothetical protein